jgi:hypothetical protein
MPTRELLFFALLVQVFLLTLLQLGAKVHAGQLRGGALPGLPVHQQEKR